VSPRALLRRVTPTRLRHGTVALLVSASLLSVAGAEGEPSARGFYAGAGVGASRLEPETPIASLIVGEERDTGFHVSLGYDISRWLSAELQLADLGAAGIDRTLAGDGTNGPTTDTDFDAIEYRIVDVAALLYLFDTRAGFIPGRGGVVAGEREGLSLYARLGVGAMFNDSERDRVRHERVESAHLTTGLGLEYGFGRGFAARAEYLAYDTDAHYASLGVIKRFGRGSTPEPSPLLVSDPVQNPPEDPPPSPRAPPTAGGGRFAFDSATLSPTARESLDRFAASVGEGDSELLVQGHTDSVGPAAYNEGLGSRRARAARDYLIGLGIAVERLRVESFGEERPLGTNTTAEGRARNRRVELRER